MRTSVSCLCLMLLLASLARVHPWHRVEMGALRQGDLLTRLTPGRKTSYFNRTDCPGTSSLNAAFANGMSTETFGPDT